MKVLGLILSGSKHNNLNKLTKKRTSAAVPIFGKYRAIDFTLSNMINSGINKIGVLTQYNPRSLMDHLGSGKEWNLDKKRGGLFILQPFLSVEEHIMHYRGTADAIFQNMTLLRRADEDFVLIGSGDHIYNIDYRKLYKFHIRNGSDITLLTKNNNGEYDFKDYGQPIVNENKIIDFKEKTEKQASDKIFLGVYFMNKALLMDLLYSSVPNGEYDLLSIILQNLKKLRVLSYDFKGYWKNIKKSLLEYYNINMDILNPEIKKELFFNQRKIYTKIKDYAPQKININANVSNSFIADGSIINGIIKNSVISRGVKVKAGAIIENSIILQDSIIKEGCIIKKVIMDKNTTIREGKILESHTNEIIVVEKGSVL